MLFSELVCQEGYEICQRICGITCVRNKNNSTRQRIRQIVISDDIEGTEAT
jgi:hypothetical protein